MDPTNVMGMLKAVWDGLEDVCVYENDRQVKRLEVDQKRDPDGAGYMEVEITEIVD